MEYLICIAVILYLCIGGLIANTQEYDDGDWGGALFGVLFWPLIVIAWIVILLICGYQKIVKKK